MQIRPFANWAPFADLTIQSNWMLVILPGVLLAICVYSRIIWSNEYMLEHHLKTRKPAIPWFTAAHATYVIQKQKRHVQFSQKFLSQLTHVHTIETKYKIARNKRHNDMYQPVTRLTTQSNQNWLLNYLQFIKVNDFYRSAFYFYFSVGLSTVL